MKINSTHFDIRLILASILFLAAALSAEATNYYVAVTGTNVAGGGLFATNAWSTITYAASKMYPGDTAYISSGDYCETVSTVRAGTGAGMITFSGLSATTRRFKVLHEFTAISNLVFEGANGAAAVVQIATSNVRLVGSTVRNADVDSYSIITMTSGGTIPATMPTNLYIGACRIIGSKGHCITLYADYSLIESNYISDTWMDAFRVWGSNSVYRANTVSNLYINGENHPDFVQTYGPTRSSHDITIENNIVLDSYAQPCNLSQDGVTNAQFGNWTFINNVFKNVAGNGNVGIPNCRWYNNTFYLCQTDHAYSVAFLAQNAGSVTNAFFAVGGDCRNNLFVACGDPSGPTNTTGFYLVAAGCAGTCTTDYNYACGRAPTYPAKTGFTNDAHGVNGGNPLLADADNGNLSVLANSPAINAGVSLDAVTTDILGRPRSATPTIGAYEYVPTPPHHLLPIFRRR